MRVPDDAVLADLAAGVVAAEDPDAERVLDDVALDHPHRHLRHRDPPQQCPARRGSPGSAPGRGARRSPRCRRGRSHRSTRLGGCVPANEMSMPCAPATVGESISQSRIVSELRRALMPSIVAPPTRTPSSTTSSLSRTSIPIAPPKTVTSLMVTPSASMRMPPRTTAPGSPTSVCASSRTSGPLVHAGREPHDGRLREPCDAEDGQERRGGGRRRAPGLDGPARRPRRRSRAAGAAAPRGRAPAPGSRTRAKNQTAGPSGASSSSRRASAIVRPELQQAERQRGPPGLVGQQPVVHRRVEREADGGHDGGELERPPLVQGERETARDEEGAEHGGEPRLEAAPQREGHRRTRWRNRRAAYFIPTSVSAAGYAHWAGTPASESVREAS